MNFPLTKSKIIFLNFVVSDIIHESLSKILFSNKYLNKLKIIINKNFSSILSYI
jgi:hypothetical protein